MADEIEEIFPVVMTKPKRGQEIASMPINEELFHEGYVAGIKYLVPDSNLEAMKDTINLKMRPRISTRYKHQTSYELADYEHFKIKLKKLLSKIDEVSSSSSSECTESTGKEYIKRALVTDEEEIIDKENECIDSSIKNPISEESLCEPIALENGDSIYNDKSKYQIQKSEKPGNNIHESDEAESDGSISYNQESDSEDLENDNGNEINSENELSNSEIHKIDHQEEPCSDTNESESELFKVKSVEEETLEICESESEDVQLEDGEERISEIIESDRESEDIEYSEDDNFKRQHSKEETNYGSALRIDNLEPGNIKKVVIKPLSEMAVDSKPDVVSITQVNETISQSIEPEQPNPLHNEQRLRFLISGHLQKGKEPIYIIQEYDGVGNIFGEQRADFISRKSEGGTDIIISGKFYKGNILEESNDKPVFLNTKPNKIQINPKTSKIYYDVFEEKFSMSSVDLIINGKFIKNDNNMTPFFAFKVNKKMTESKKQNSHGKYEQSRRILYNTGIENKNPFIQYFSASHSASNQELKKQMSINQYNTMGRSRVIDNCYYFSRPKLMMSKEIVHLLRNKSMSMTFYSKSNSRKASYTNITLKKQQTFQSFN